MSKMAELEYEQRMAADQPRPTLREAAQAVMVAETLGQMAAALDALRDALADVHIEEANARLIAAAPDLLTALRAVLNQSWDGPLPDFIREKACDALAKAEGQE